jgi:pimeloyl-ACP methyl ester carboxylesterase
MALRRPVLVLGHGASGSAATMAPHVAGLQLRGIDARAVDLPKGRAERAVPIFARLLASEPGIVVGGHSFGGRVAEPRRGGRLQTAGDHPSPWFSSRIRTPGPAGRLGRADGALAGSCPVIVLSGTSDPFAMALLARALAKRTAGAGS